MKRCNGEGTIYKRKDGRWCGAYYDESPEPKRHFVYGRTQTEVKKKIKEKQINPVSEDKEEDTYTLAAWVLYYLENYKRHEIKETTYDSYIGIYRKHIVSSDIGKIKISRLSCDLLQKFYNEKYYSGYNAKTVRHIYILINTALKKALSLRYIKENVNELVTLPKKKAYEGKVLSAEEVRKIITYATSEEIYPIVALTICTGLRKGEVMSLMWDNVNLEEKELYVETNLCRVRNKTDDNSSTLYCNKIMDPKTDKSRRVIPLIDIAIDALKIQKKRQDEMKAKFKDIYRDDGYVFTELDGSILRQRGFMDKYHDFLKKYEVSDIRFHDLRHPYVKPTTKKL